MFILLLFAHFAITLQGSGEIFLTKNRILLLCEIFLKIRGMQFF